MRLVANPPNPFASQYVEYLDEPPRARLEVYEEHAGEILSQNDSPDIPFRWSINPYRGCQHACAYCYARPTHEYLGYGAGSDFDSKIVAKVNAAALLERRLASKRWQRESIAFSGVTDCYQPLEAVYGLTRSCLEVCLRRRQPVGIVTKSYLVVRDVDLLAELASVARLRVFMSIAFAEDRVARTVDAGAPPTSRRFEALRKLAHAGVRVGVMVAPIIPGLNDRDIATILAGAAECGASAAGCMPLRLPGHVADVFLDRLRRDLPDHASRVEQQVRAMRDGRLHDPRFGHRMRGEGEYWHAVEQLFTTTARRFGLAPARERAAASTGQIVAGDKSSIAQAFNGAQSVQLTLFSQSTDRH